MSFHGAFWSSQRSFEKTGDVHPYAIHLADILNQSIDFFPKQFIPKTDGVFYGEETTPIFRIANGYLSLRLDPQYPTDCNEPMKLISDNYINDCVLQELIKDSKSMGSFYQLNRCKK